MRPLALCALYSTALALDGERLTHLSVGRRKLVRRDWLEHWMENNKTR